MRCEHGPLSCEMGAAYCEIGSKDGEMKYFSSKIGPERGVGSSFPGGQGAMECGLADDSRELDFVRCEMSVGGGFKSCRRRLGRLVSVSP